MRYIYYIIIILLVISAIIGYELIGKRDSVNEKDAALIINGRVITNDEFNKLYSSCPPYLRNKSDFINSLITKELLIQESQKESIDKEESFRRSIQNFYEQSLMKLLMDRKFSSLNITVSDDELNRYIMLLNSKLHLTVFNFDTLEEAKQGKYRDSEKKIVFLDDLSKDIKPGIILIEEGRTTDPIKSEEKYITIRLDKIETFLFKTPSDTEKESIKSILISEKKEKAIDDWIADLRKKASIKIFLNEKN